MSEGTELMAPALHLDGLLARALNPFDVSDSALARLGDAVLCQVELNGWRHRNTPPPTLRCSSFRHIFLLSDGSSELLWELRYDSEEGDGRRLYEVYETEGSLRLAERRVHRLMGDGIPGAGGGHAPWDGEDFTDDGDVPGGHHGHMDHEGHAAYEAHEAHEAHEGRDAWDDGDEEPGTRHRSGGGGPGRISFDFLTGTARGPHRRRAYGEGDSPEHARRLLRRAENPDRPGDEVLRLLATARGHEILHMPQPHAPAHAWHVWCSVYEHAFLLADGSEISLYELEHNMSGSGHLVCEVYLEESVADQAAHRRARDRGFEL
ncbi:DUF6227 family protein [Streptomyces daliensis]